MYDKFIGLHHSSEFELAFQHNCQENLKLSSIFLFLSNYKLLPTINVGRSWRMILDNTTHKDINQDYCNSPTGSPILFYYFSCIKTQQQSFLTPITLTKSEFHCLSRVRGNGFVYFYVFIYLIYNLSNIRRLSFELKEQIYTCL